MADNTYSVEYATNARAKCKYSGCGESIAKDSLRIIKSCSSAFSEKPKAEYYHAECMFLSFVRARKTTKKIESMKDIEGVDGIKSEDKENIKKYIKQWKEGEFKDKVPKINRKRKADTDNTDVQKAKKQKKAKDSSSDSEEELKTKPKAKAASPVKRKPAKKQQDSDDDSDDRKDTKKRKTTKKPKDSDSEDDDKVSKMMRKPVSKPIDSESSESESEKNPPLKIQLKDTKKKKVDSDEDSEEDTKKKKKKIESDSESEEDNKKNKKKVESDSESEKDTPPLKINLKDTKKKKVESAEEVEETSSSEKQDSPKSKGPLSGYVIALSGKLSMTSAEIAKLIEKNGGTFSKSITKDVTHVICAKKDDKTKKLTKAKEDGKTIVDEKFLKNKIKI